MNYHFGVNRYVLIVAIRGVVVDDFPQH